MADQEAEFIGVKDRGMGAGRATQLPMPGMCFYHREMPATYVCSKCGRSMCTSCDKTYGPLHFCPQCNPFPGGTPAEPQAQPLPPRGRGLFITGAAGSVLMGVMAIVLGLIPLINWWDRDGQLDFNGDAVGLYYIGALVLFVGSILTGIGLAGFYRNYRNASGIVGVVFATIFSTLFFIFTLFSFDYYRYNVYDVGIEIWFAQIFAGIMLIGMGTAFLLAGKHTGRRGTGIAAGTLFIVAGSMLIPMLGFLGIAWFILTAGAFVATYFFAKAPAYSKYTPVTQAQPQIQFQQVSPQPAQQAAVDSRLEMLNRVYAEGKISDEDYMANFEHIQREKKY